MLYMIYQFDPVSIFSQLIIPKGILSENVTQQIDTSIYYIIDYQC